MIFHGQVKPGFGTGAFYVQLPHYHVGFTELLRKAPYPGTLNVLFSEKNYLELAKVLEPLNPLIISGKRGADQGDWRIQCYCTRIWSTAEKENVKALLLRFSRPDHKKEIIEFVSHYHLREKFHLKDNDSIKFKLIP
jgi:riboflavin kinase